MLGFCFVLFCSAFFKQIALRRSPNLSEAPKLSLRVLSRDLISSFYPNAGRWLPPPIRTVTLSHAQQLSCSHGYRSAGLLTGWLHQEFAAGELSGDPGRTIAHIYSAERIPWLLMGSGCHICPLLVLPLKSYCSHRPREIQDLSPNPLTAFLRETISLQVSSEESIPPQRMASRAPRQEDYSSTT